MSILDMSGAPSGEDIEADIAVIGGGMAAAALAHELAGSSFKVVVIESGGLTAKPDVDDLYRGTGTLVRPDGSTANIDKYLTNSRVRALGGSGNRWGGRCAPLEEADFSRRPWISHSGWPITRRQLQPYYLRACDRLKIPRAAATWDGKGEMGRPSYLLSPEFFSSSAFYSPCTGRRAGSADWHDLRQGYAAAVNIRVFLNANVTEIVLHPRTQHVAHLKVACLNGRRHSVRARTYVLAAGGIENARLLLASQSLREEGVANKAGLVGRYFQGHVGYGVAPKAGNSGSAIIFTAPGSLELYDNLGPGRAHGAFTAKSSLQARRGMGSFEVNLHRAMKPPDEAPLSALQGLCGLFDQGVVGAGYSVCGFQAEGPPDRESRITLAKDTDALGVPRAHLNWAWNEGHWTTLKQGTDALAETLGAGRRGRLSWPLSQHEYSGAADLANHHMGTTRMHRDPEHGVVDPNGRCHDVANLYVAGSSLFPTSGVANPTLTIVALTVRLADHLKLGLNGVP